VKYRREIFQKNIALEYYAEITQKLREKVRYYQGKHRGWKGAFKKMAKVENA
jgi:hypothetical protein